jgi:hypothetical protein
MKWDTDRIVSISAMLVGLGSLFIVLYQTTLMREQAKASVLPYLLIAFNTNNDGSYIALKNVGLGPALIDRIRVIHQGKAFDGDPYAYYASLGDAKVPANNVYRDRVLPGMLIPAGSNPTNMLGSVDPSQMSSELLRTFQFVAVEDGLSSGKGSATAPEKAVLEIEYSSVYSEHWRVRSDRVVPERL